MTLFPKVNPLFHGLVATLLAALIVLPAAYLDSLPLAIAAGVGLGLALLLFSNPLYALIGFVVLVPLEESIVIDGFGTITRLAGILFFASYLFHRRFRLDSRAVPIAAWLWFGWATLSLLWIVEPDMVGYFQLFQLFFMAFLVAELVSREPTYINPVLNWYTASSLIVALLGINNFLAGVSVEGDFNQASRTSAIEGQGVENFAFYLIPAFFTSLHRSLHADKWYYRLLYLALSAVFIVAILLSGTRGAWLAVLGGFLFVVLPRLRPRQWLIFGIGVLFSVIAVLQVPAVAEFVGFRAGNALSSGGAGRTAIWKISTEVFLDHPIKGVGFRNFKEAVSLHDFEDANFDIYLDKPFVSTVTHNIYLQVAAELGLIGLIFWFIWFYALLNVRPGTKEWTLVLAIAVAMLVGGLTNPELNRKYFWLPIGLLMGLRYAHLKTRVSTLHSSERALVQQDA